MGCGAHGRRPRSGGDDLTDELLTIDGHEFVLRPLEGRRGTDGPIVLKKPRWLLERYLDLAEEFPDANIVELGLFDGGSMAFLASAFRPRALLGLELATEPLTSLDRFLDGSPLRDVVHVQLGVDQADRAAVRAAVASHIDGALDLVIDDASHLLGPTTASFDCLFPLIRPHGVFVVEDWSHDHRLAWGVRRRLASGDLTVEQIAHHIDPGARIEPLSRLIVDLVLATSSPDGIVDEVQVREGFALVRRGDAEIDPDTFSLRDHIGELGRAVSPRPA
ncbi:MAG: class I SAM-dependent methyltransferase [Acidimicrobiales bacterium]